MDAYFVSIPGIHYYLWDRYNNKRLPNPVDTKVFQKTESSLALDHKVVNIFYPTGFRAIKNPRFALELMIHLQQRYTHVHFYFIEHARHHKHIKKYKRYLDQLTNITRLSQIPREKMPEYYSADRDLVLWAFNPHKEYAILNMIENEAIACKAPVLGHDLHEIILEPLENMTSLACKIIENKEYKTAYIDKLYTYIIKVHAMEHVAKLYEKEVLKLMNK